MINYKVKKSLIFLIIIIFVCSSFVSSISGFSNQSYQTKIDESNNIPSPENVKVSCSTYGKPYISSKEVEIPYSEVENLFKKINSLAEKNAYNPSSDQTKKLQQSILKDAQKYNLLPNDISLEKLQPSFFTKLNMKNPKESTLPVVGNRGTASLCNFVTTGTGMQFPIIILPRMIPILLTPIPRAFLHWSANEGFTSCGSYLTRTGFMAEGMQRGTALGFWGIGFSVFIPPVMAYGFIGYALFATCTAEEIEPWPPNYAPVVSAVSPVDGAENVAISTSELSFRISDDNGDLMDYIVTTSPDIGSGSENNKPSGTYFIPISDLEGTEEYSWFVEVSDGQKTVEKSFSFNTEQVAPIVSNPYPEDCKKYVPYDISQLSFKLEDPQDDLMDYTVETIPDIGSGNGFGVSKGTYSIDVSGLKNLTMYNWYVNVTDGINWKHKTFSFQTEPMMNFDPFDEGWLYRKKITINHTKVAGNLSNFPILMSTIDPDLQEKAQDEGGDILFMNNSGFAARLYHEIESYSETTGELVAWINVSNISSFQDTTFYIYYGNPTCHNQHTPELVWDSAFVMVQHLNEKNGIHFDSTMKSNEGIPKGDLNQDAIGKLNGADEFDCINDFIRINNSDDLNFGTEDFSYSLWIKQNTHSEDAQQIICKRIPKKGNYETQITKGQELQSYIGKGSKLSYAGIQLNKWYYICIVRQSGIGRLYINANLENSISAENTVSTNEDLYIGKDPQHETPEYFNGIIDEVRISNKPRCQEWISTSYNNQDNPQGFLSVGPEET